MHHFTSHHVDRNDGDAVYHSIMAYLEEHAALHQMCEARTAAASKLQEEHSPPDKTAILAALEDLVKPPANLSLMSSATNESAPPATSTRGRGAWDKSNKKCKPCWHCGGDHWNEDCQDERSGTKSYLHQQRQLHNTTSGRNKPAGIHTLRAHPLDTAHDINMI